MKLLIFFSLFLFSCLSEAYPSVGDKVKWTGSVNTLEGGVTPVIITKEVVKFNSASKKWTVKYEAAMGEDRTSKLIEVEELYSPTKFKEILAKCEAEGGLREKVTAPAGTYETCKMTVTTEDGVRVEKWWGDIPFGVVGKNTQDLKTRANKLDLNSIVAGL